MKKWAKTDKSSLSYVSSKFWPCAWDHCVDYWILEFGARGDIFRKGGAKIKKSKNNFCRQNISSGYFSERKNWEENDENIFRTIKSNHKKLWRMRAQKTLIYPVFRNFNRGKSHRFSKFFYQYVRLYLTSVWTNFGWLPMKLTGSKLRKTRFLGLFLDEKSVFPDFNRGNSG